MNDGLQSSLLLCNAAHVLHYSQGEGLHLWFCWWNFYIPLTAAVVEVYVLRNVLITWTVFVTCLLCARFVRLLTHRSLISKLCGLKLCTAFRQYSVPHSSSILCTKQFFRTLYDTVLRYYIPQSSSGLCTTQFFSWTYHTVLQYYVPDSSSGLYTTQFFSTIYHRVLQDSVPHNCTYHTFLQY